MEVVIFDIEASCEDRNLNPHYNMETIELGAAKVKDGIVIDTFQTFIKPEYVDTLTPFCTKLTGITYDDLEDAPGFNEGILEFYSFIYGLPIYSCGEFDRKFLVRELREKGTSYSHKMVENAILSSHKNLKIHFKNVTGKGMPGMNKMASILDIEIDGTAHRALDDSLNLAKIYIKLEKIREYRLNDLFNESKLSKLIEDMNKHHNTNIEVTNKGIKVNNEDSTSKLTTMEFLDIWRDVIMIDHVERELDYLSEDDIKAIDRFTRY